MNATRLDFLRGALSALGIGALGGRALFAAPPGWKPSANPNLVLGMISDTHLRTTVKGNGPGKAWPVKYFKAALSHFRSVGVDAVVHCGDFAHRGQDAEMGFHAKVWNEVFPDNRGEGGRKVVKLFVTGNHDIDGGTYGDFVAKRYPDEKERKKHLLVSDISSKWRQYWDEGYRDVWHKIVKGYHFFGFNYGADGTRFARLIESYGSALSGAKPFFYIQHVRPNGPIIDTVGKFSNAVGLYGHAHRSAANLNVVALENGKNAMIQVPACEPRGSGFLSGDAYIIKGRIVGRESIGETRQGYVVKVYDKFMTIERREFGQGGKLGPDLVLALGQYEPHPFSRGELKRQMGTPEFPDGARLSLKTLKNEYSLRIPVANGNPDSRVYAYEATLTCEGLKNPIVRGVYAVGCNMGMGHEPKDANTPLSFRKSEVPNARTLLFSVRPMSSLGAAGKPISGKFDV